MENIINSLEENLKELYRKAIDADNQIDELKKQGHGKFQTIFKGDQLFSAQADKFMPYLEEVAEQILHIKTQQDTAGLEDVVKKLHLLHKTLGEFKGAIRS